MKQKTVIGASMEDINGQKTVKNADKQQINTTAGNVAIYSDLTNGQKKLVQFHQTDALDNILGDMYSKNVIYKGATSENKIKEKLDKMVNKP